MRFLLKSVLMGLVLLALVATGCGGKKAEPTSPPTTVQEVAPATPTPMPPTPTPTTPPQPTVAPTKAPPTPQPTSAMHESAMMTPTSAPEEAEGAPTFQLPQKAKTFKTYEAHALYQLKDLDTGKTVPVLELVLRYNGEQKAQEIIAKTTDADGTVRESRIIQVGDKVWYLSDGQWISMSSGTENLNQALTLFDPKDLGTYWKKVGKEKLHGVEVIHYRLKRSEVSAQDFEGSGTVDPLFGPGTQLTDVKIEMVDADVYVTKDGVVVKEGFTWRISGKKEGKPVHVEGSMVFDLTKINGDVKIEPPAAASEQVEMIVPLPEGAKTMMSSPQMGVYQVENMGPEEVAAYLQKQLKANGFSVDEVTKAMGMIGIKASKGDKRFEISILPGEGGKGAQVMVQVH